MDAGRGGAPLTSLQKFALGLPFRRTPNAWDAIAEDFSVAAPHLPNAVTTPALLAAIAPTLREHKIALNCVVSAGSGQGQLAQSFQDVAAVYEELGVAIPRVLEADFSQGMLARSDADLRMRSDVRRLPLADRSMDGWECSHISHLREDDALAALVEAVRVVRTGGVLWFKSDSGKLDPRIDPWLRALGAEPFVSLNSPLTLDALLKSQLSETVLTQLSRTRVGFYRVTHRSGLPEDDKAPSLIDLELRRLTHEVKDARFTKTLLDGGRKLLARVQAGPHRRSKALHALTYRYLLHLFYDHEISKPDGGISWTHLDQWEHVIAAAIADLDTATGNLATYLDINRALIEGLRTYHIIGD